jgi:hypothetical protein
LPLTSAAIPGWSGRHQPTQAGPPRTCMAWRRTRHGSPRSHRVPSRRPRCGDRPRPARTVPPMAVLPDASRARRPTGVPRLATAAGAAVTRFRTRHRGNPAGSLHLREPVGTGNARRGTPDSGRCRYGSRTRKHGPSRSSLARTGKRYRDSRSSGEHHDRSSSGRHAGPSQVPDAIPQRRAISELYRKQRKPHDRMTNPAMDLRKNNRNSPPGAETAERLFEETGDAQAS